MQNETKNEDILITEHRNGKQLRKRMVLHSVANSLCKLPKHFSQGFGALSHIFHVFRTAGMSGDGTGQ
jgi:hypothetical protein